MPYSVVWDDPNIQVRAIVSSRTEFRQLLEALNRHEDKLPADPPQAGKPEEKPHVAD